MIQAEHGQSDNSSRCSNDPSPCWMSSIATCPGTAGSRRSGTRPSLPGPDAHEAGKSGGGGESPASGHRTSQEPRRRVPEQLSYRIDLALSLSNLGAILVRRERTPRP